MASGRRLFTSESVTEGHPDKVCDQISDAVLDAVLEKEARLEEGGYVTPDGRPARVADARCACETLATTGVIVVAGEIRTQAYVDVEGIARDTLRRIGYVGAECGFDADSCGVINMIHEQSPDIALGVDGAADAGVDDLSRMGAGDQGMVFGYACDETDALMPMPIFLAGRMARRLAAVRHDGTLPYLRPDGKTQVTVRYEGDRPVGVDAVVVSAQHAADVDVAAIKGDMVAQVVAPTLEAVGLPWDGARVLVNPTGRFVVGGPAGDTGLTGRKIVVDTYGGMGRHGGGAFSGKDATKVDRSGAYAARWVAKNVVAAGLARRCEVQVAYAIGVAEPVSVRVDTFGTGTVADDVVADAVKEVFDLRPAAIIATLDLLRPIFERTAAYGHFGREEADFSWERRNRVDELCEAAGV